MIINKDEGPTEKQDFYTQMKLLPQLLHLIPAGTSKA